jgi:hypothetical protein
MLDSFGIVSVSNRLLSVSIDRIFACLKRWLNLQNRLLSFSILQFNKASIQQFDEASILAAAKKALLKICFSRWLGCADV